MVRLLPFLFNFNLAIAQTYRSFNFLHECGAPLNAGPDCVKSVPSALGRPWKVQANMRTFGVLLVTVCLKISWNGQTMWDCVQAGCAVYKAFIDAQGLRRLKCPCSGWMCCMIQREGLICKELRWILAKVLQTAMNVWCHSLYGLCPFSRVKNINKKSRRCNVLWTEMVTVPGFKAQVKRSQLFRQTKVVCTCRRSSECYRKINVLSFKSYRMWQYIVGPELLNPEDDGIASLRNVRTARQTTRRHIP
jgi:hypothetical protein